MGATPIYKLRWPERVGEAADGPDGYKDLASDVEDQMVRFRQRSSYAGWMNPQPIIQPGQDVSILDFVVTPPVAGWMQFEYQVNIIGWAGGCFAGWVDLRLGPGNPAPRNRAQRWHNNCRGTMWYVTGRAAFPTLDLAPVRYTLNIRNEGASSNYIRIGYVPHSLQYYGGKP